MGYKMDIPPHPTIMNCIVIPDGQHPDAHVKLRSLYLSRKLKMLSCSLCFNVGTEVK